MEPLSRAQRRTLIALLGQLPNLADATTRRLLLADLPPALQAGLLLGNAPSIDVASLVARVDEDAWRILPDGTRAVGIVVENAIDLVPGSRLAEDLHAFLATIPAPVLPPVVAPTRPAVPLVSYRERRELFALLTRTITTFEQLRSLCVALHVRYAMLQGDDLPAKLESLAWEAQQQSFFGELGGAARDEAERQVLEAQEIAAREAREQAQPEAREQAQPEAREQAQPEVPEQAQPEVPEQAQPEAQACLERGNADRAAQLYPAALVQYTRALQLDPSFALAYNARGNIYVGLQRYEEALADFTRALQLDPSFALAYNGRGVAYYQLRHYEEALADFTRALQLDPNYGPTYTVRGFAYHTLERYEEALADYTRALQLDPTDARAYTNRGVTYHTLERYEKALADFTRALQLDPNLTTAYRSRASTNRLMGRIKEAQADEARARELEGGIK